MARTTINLDDKIFKTIATIAKRENRSTPNFIETVLMEHLQNDYYVGDAEQSEFENDIELQKSIRHSLQEYKKGRGRFL